MKIEACSHCGAEISPTFYCTGCGSSTGEFEIIEVKNEEYDQFVREVWSQGFTKEELKEIFEESNWKNKTFFYSFLEDIEREDVLCKKFLTETDY